MAAAQPMSVDEREKKEEEEFRTGPLSVLTTSVKTNSQARTGGQAAPPTPWLAARASAPRLCRSSQRRRRARHLC
jgi:hypothetical protein